MGSTSKRAVLMAGIAVLCAMPAFADSYTSSAAFNAAISGMSDITTANFDSDPTEYIAEGATADGITFNYNINGGADSLAIVSTAEFFDTTSEPNYLGSNDPTTGAFFPGDSITMSFSSPVNALGMFIIGGPYNDGDFTLASSTASALSSSVLEETLGDGGQVIFLGISSATSFSSATISLNASAGELWNLDDITSAVGSTRTPPPPAPEPSSFALLVAGLALCAAVLSRRRRATGFGNSGIFSGS